MTGVLKKIGVLPAHCSTKIWKFDKEPEPNAAGVAREAEKWADGLEGTSRMQAAASLPRIAELGSGLEVGFRVEGSGGIHEPPPQQLPSMQEFGLSLAHSPAGGYQYNARPLQLPASSMRNVPPVQKKKPAQKPMQHAYGSGRQPLTASGRLLSLMSTFYGRVKPLHEHNPTLHDTLLLHFRNSDWPHMTIEKLKAFVETTFRGQTDILNAFYEVFREHLPAEEPKTATPQQEHAAWFCAEVRRVYGPTSPTYNGFIETMNQYAKKDRDTLGTIRAIKNLFQDSPNLIVEFANFVPEVYKKHCTMDKRPGKRKAVEQRAAGGASAAGTALQAATTPRSKDFFEELAAAPSEQHSAAALSMTASGSVVNSTDTLLDDIDLTSNLHDPAGGLTLSTVLSMQLSTEDTLVDNSYGVF
jgi:hypothetical protein